MNLSMVRPSTWATGLTVVVTGVVWGVVGGLYTVCAARATFGTSTVPLLPWPFRVTCDGPGTVVAVVGTCTVVQCAIAMWGPAPMSKAWMGTLYVVALAIATVEGLTYDTTVQTYAAQYRRYGHDGDGAAPDTWQVHAGRLALLVTYVVVHTVVAARTVRPGGDEEEAAAAVGDTTDTPEEDVWEDDGAVAVDDVAVVWGDDV